MPTLAANGSQTAVIGTEHTIYNPTGVNKFFTGYIDLKNMIAGDTVEIRVSVIVNASSTYSLYWLGTYSGVQSDPLVYISPLPADLGYKITLKQIMGTGRVYDYRVYEV